MLFPVRERLVLPEEEKVMLPPLMLRSMAGEVVPEAEIVCNSFAELKSPEFEKTVPVKVIPVPAE